MLPGFVGPPAAGSDASAMLGLLLIVYAIVFAINVVPAFMPPTWSVLAFFLIHDHLPLLPLTIGGAIAASGGRLTLALLSRGVGPRILSQKRQEGLRLLGCWLDAKARVAAPLAVLVFSFGPIPSNELFIASGLTGIRLPPVVGAFLAGRLVSYNLWALAARTAADHLGDLFSPGSRGIGALALQVAALAALVVLARIDWLALLGAGRLGPPEPSDTSTAGRAPPTR